MKTRHLWTWIAVGIAVAVTVGLRSIKHAVEESPEPPRDWN